MRYLFATIGAVALPLAALALNNSMRVVEVGPWTIAAIVLPVLSALLHFFLTPIGYDAIDANYVYRRPQSLAANITLTAISGLSTVVCSYFSLLLLPLLPISAVGLIFGIGIVGFSPYTAAAVSIVHWVRDARSLGRVLSRRGRALVVGASVLAPICIGATAIVAGMLERRQVEQALARIAATPPLSRQRMAAIAELAGQETPLLKRFSVEPDVEKRQLIAIVYHRLSERHASQDVSSQPRHTFRRAAIRPAAPFTGGPVFSQNGGFFRW